MMLVRTERVPADTECFLSVHRLTNGKAALRLRGQVRSMTGRRTGRRVQLLPVDALLTILHPNKYPQ